MTEFSIPKDRVPKQLYSTYDFCAKGGKNDKEIDTQEEISKFFRSAELTLLNKRISNDDYYSFINEFKAEKEQADAYEKQKNKAWREEKKEIIKKKIAQLEADIKAFEDYQKENPKTSAMHNALNKTEIIAESVVGVAVITLASLIPFVDTKATADIVKKNLDDARKNGNIQTSEYNKLMSKADYEKLAYLKKVLNNPYPPRMALKKAAAD